MSELAGFHKNTDEDITARKPQDMAATTLHDDGYNSRAYAGLMERSRAGSLARRDLSGGGKAGVAIGVILIVVIAVGGTWFFLRKRRAQRQEGGVESGSSSEIKPSPPKDKAVPENKYVLPNIPVGGIMSAPPTAVANKVDTRPFIPELAGSDTTGVPLAREAPTHYVEMDSNQQPVVDRKPSEGSNILPIQVPPPLPKDSAPSSPLATGPETQVSIHPGPVPYMHTSATEPLIRAPDSTGGLPAAVTSEDDLRAHHAQLEESRRKIELEQAALTEQMKALHDKGSSTA